MLDLTDKKDDIETHDLVKRCLDNLSRKEFEKLSGLLKRRFKKLGQLYASGNLEKAANLSYDILEKLDPIQFPTVHYELLHELLQNLTTQREGWGMPLVGDKLEDRNSRLRLAIRFGKDTLDRTHRYSPFQIAETYNCIAVFLKHIQPQVEENLNEAIKFQEQALTKIDRKLGLKTFRIYLSNLGNFHSILAVTYGDSHYQQALHYSDQAIKQCSLENETARWFFINETKIQFQRQFTGELINKEFAPLNDTMKDLLIANDPVEILSYLAQYSVPLYWESFDRKIFTLILDVRDDGREDVAQILLLVRDYAALSTDQGFNKAYEFAENAAQKGMELVFLKMLVGNSSAIEQLIRNNKDIVMRKSARDYIKKYMGAMQENTAESLVKKASGLYELIKNSHELGLDEALERWRNENTDLELSFSDEIHAPEVFLPTNVYRRVVKKFYNALDEKTKREVVYDYRSTLLSQDCEPYFRILELKLIEDDSDSEAASFLMNCRGVLSHYREVGFEGAHRFAKELFVAQAS